MVSLALQAVTIVKRSSTEKAPLASHVLGTDQSHLANHHSPIHNEVDIKRYAKIEKIPGASMEECQVIQGIIFEKDITHSKMRRRIENPKILLLDCPLEYKKGESQTNVEITEEDDWNALLRMEEEYVENICMEIIAFGPDIVITEKGVSDLAQHYLQKANITAFRRLRKSDNNRVARAVGATIVSRPDEIQESDIGTGCGLFEMKRIGDEWYCYLEKCKDPKACTILLRGGSTDILNEIERNLADAMEVVRNVVFEPRLLPGGGAIEMAVAVGIKRASMKIEGRFQLPFQKVGQAMEVIPRTLAQNCGVNVIRAVTALRAKHEQQYDDYEQDNMKEQFSNYGINGTTGDIVPMAELGIWEPFNVKVQAIKTSIENACMILRIDEIVAGSASKKDT